MVPVILTVSRSMPNMTLFAIAGISLLTYIFSYVILSWLGRVRNLYVDSMAVEKNFPLGFLRLQHGCGPRLPLTALGWFFLPLLLVENIGLKRYKYTSTGTSASPGPTANQSLHQPCSPLP